ncbi:unnamed protein product [Camellia sinensis]
MRVREMNKGSEGDEQSEGDDGGSEGDEQRERRRFGPFEPQTIRATQQNSLIDRVTTLILVLSLLPALVLTCSDLSEFNVLDYGAVGDGMANDTLAFVEAWNRTCNAESEDASMVVPEGMTFLVYPVAFVGPCNPTYITFLLSGTIIAPHNPEAWKGRNLGQWLTFQDVNGLGVSGPGKIDGRGQGWWDISCKRHPQSPGCGKLAPTVLSFTECNQFSISNILIVNSPQTHILVTGCNNVMIDSLTIKSPETSPNTDGIHISHSTGVFVSNTDIGSGDDCVSIGDYTSHIDITNVNCGPGHGVSIGSLGRSGNEVRVENINVNRVNFNKTSNGVRIKTWQVGRGHVRRVVFKNINFTDVKNPIIINQNYRDVKNARKRMKAGVEISHVRYSGTFGTSKTEVAINLDCSQAVPCTNILLDTVELESSSPGKRVISFCNNAYGNATGVVICNVIWAVNLKTSVVKQSDILGHQPRIRDLRTTFLVLCTASLGLSSDMCQEDGSDVFNVLDYEVVGDGIRDDSTAFLAAWTAACGAVLDTSTLYIPEGSTFLLNPAKFQGPCRSSSIDVQVYGNIVAPDIIAWTGQNLNNWLIFSNVNGLTVSRNGQIDGQGSNWWDQYNDSSVGQHSRISRDPLQALAFRNCNNLQLSGLTHVNGPRRHISVVGSTGLTISNLQITAPEDSPNTDGIDISQSSNVQIHDCIIGTGDDCHGISIGSLGKGGAMDTVEEVHVRNCSFTGTMFGARIKSWQGGSGYARYASFKDITLIAAANPIIIDQFYWSGYARYTSFKDITLIAAANPIIIDQFYCTTDKYCTNKTEAVQVSDVTYDGFYGTSITDNAVKLSCSETVGCTDIVLSNIALTSQYPNHVLSSSCLNAQGTSTAINPVVDCLLP